MMLAPSSKPGGANSADAAHRVSAAVFCALAAARAPHGQKTFEPPGGNRERWRGNLDALALNSRYSDPEVHARHAPTTGARRALFDMLEAARVESLGASRYVGVRKNLARLLEEMWVRARPEGVMPYGSASWIETFALLVRVPMRAPLPDAALAALDGAWRGWMTPVQVHETERLVELRTDQDSFARQALRVIDSLLGPFVAQADANRPTSRRADSGEAPLQPRESPGADDHFPGERDATRDRGVSSESGLGHAANPVAAVPRPNAYHCFTTKFDSIERAADLIEPAQLRRHRATLDERVGNRPADLARCAHRLLRYLLAAQLRSWYFDCDEGILDASRLARLIIRPLERDLYKRPAEIRCPDTVVTLLIDNSGSMRGASMTTAAVCAEVIGRTLERCAIKTEILGFTTRTWRGGRAALEWTRAGRPSAPGRIAELRHLIFKTADEPWRRARLSLGAMLADELMKENIDGEAVLWAHRRLLRRPERRKIMIVISDGSPLDEATFKGNERGYLERHLRTVIADIERQGAVEIAALGIGHDVRAYYRRAMSLRGIEELGEALVMQLIEMLGVDRRPP